MASGAFTIRPARVADAAAVAECVARAYSPYIERLGKPPGPMLDDYAQVIGRHDVYVAQMGGEIAGVLVLITTKGSILMDNVAVRPEAQGRGIGSALIAFAEDAARSLGHASLELYTHERMTENLEMYARKGYLETARRLEKGYHRVYMRKHLCVVLADS